MNLTKDQKVILNQTKIKSTLESSITKTQYIYKLYKQKEYNSKTYKEKLNNVNKENEVFKS